MKKTMVLLRSIFLLFVGCSMQAQDASSGPIIDGFGKVFTVENQDFKMDASKEFKAVLDLMNTPESYGKMNKSIETAARFLNMHAQNGIPAEQLKVALVFHNLASKDVINNEAYQKRYGTNNPNQGLIQALLDADAQIVLCGQSAAARGFLKEELIDGVQLSLSAMTALIQLQDEDYTLIKF